MKKIKDIYGLVPIQQGILFHSIYNRDSVAYSNHLTANLTGDLDVAIFQKSWNKLLLLHDVLRSSFHWKDVESPVQVVHGALNIPWTFEDLRDLDDEKQNKFFDGYISIDRLKGFDLEKPPLIRIFIVRIDDQKYRYYLSHHHIIMDGWSRSILIKELFYYYHMAKNNKNNNPLKIVAPYKNFVELKSSLSNVEKENYWKDQLKGFRLCTPLPASHSRTKKLYATNEIKENKLILSKDVSLFIRSNASKHNVTLNTFFQGVWAVLLSKYCGEEDVMFGATVSGRTIDLEGIESMVGVFINTIPVPVKISMDMNFTIWLQNLQSNQLNRERYTQTSLSDIQKWSELPSGTSLFDSILVFENYPMDFSLVENESKIKVDNVEIFENTNFPLTVIIVPGDEIYVKFLYNSDYFNERQFKIFLGHFEELVKSVFHNPKRIISEISFISNVEQKLLLTDWNNTEAHQEDATFIPDMFNTVAAIHPKSRALWFEGTSMNYQELNISVNNLANYMLSKGLKKGDIVGVCLERSMDMVIALMAILKAGGIYLPMEPSDPINRLSYIVNDSSPTFILTHEKWEQSIPKSKFPIIVLDALRQEIINMSNKHPEIDISLSDAMYLLYTSGSTGQPKGVLIPHKGARNTIVWLQKKFVEGSNNRFLQNTPFTFDISVWEIFLPLVCGFELIIAKPRGHMDSNYMITLIKEREITVLQLVPSMLRALMEDPNSKSIVSLKEVICCGEVLGSDLKNKFYTFFNCRLSNLYGPTEASIFATYYHCEITPQNGNIPIGKPIDNTQIYILDDQLRPMPIGITGALYIAGDGLAVHYHNREELTKECFIPNPFDRKAGSRMYKSGDLARYLPDGDIEYLGRNDFQLKIQGHRIEVEEIEVLLGSHSEIKEAVVITIELSEGEKKLIAYFVTKPNKLIAVNELKEFLEKELPRYLIPTHFIPITTIPLGTNGKLDRNALPLPGFTRPQLKTTYMGPRNMIERKLAIVWQDILEIEKVGINDNFFDLGGASFSTIRVVNSAQQVGIVINPEQIFKNPTIVKLAKEIEQVSLVVPEIQRPILDEARKENSVDEETKRTVRKNGNPVSITHTEAEANVLIESIGLYLPSNSVDTEVVMEQCVNNIEFPLKELTGIDKRRMAEENEFAIDLALKAMEDCFSRSRFQPEEIELLICTNISRIDNESQFSYEPSTSIKLRSIFGLSNAMVFDISNACTTTFTGLNIVEAMFRTGVVKTAMVVSGEFISHLTSTAQKEIESFMDLRMACLTVGDSGIAMILERSEDKSIGFHEIDMFTLGSYWSHCVGKLTNEVHGGPIMFNDSIKSAQALDIQKIVESALHVAARNDHNLTDFEHVIFHNTSKTTQGNAIKEINKMFNKELVNDDNYLSCLAEYGNTASTSHFVTTMLNIQNGKIKKGDKIIFGISGSGITLGTALYTFDDLPDKILRSKENGTPNKEKSVIKQQTIPAHANENTWIQIKGIGTSFPGSKSETTMPMLLEASRKCIEASGLEKEDLGVVIHSGVYRDDFLSEPAIAAILVGELDINASKTSANAKKTLAFDIINGGIGTLNACYTAVQMIRANKASNVMVATSEVENNRKLRPSYTLGIKESGAAMILTSSSNEKKGFGRFIFKYNHKYIGALNTFATWNEGINYLSYSRHPLLEKRYLEVINEAITELCALENITIHDFDLIIPPQVSEQFRDKIISEFSLLEEKVVNITNLNKNWLTASFPQSLNHAMKHKMLKEGDKILIIDVSSGVQAGCAMYYY